MGEPGRSIDAGRTGDRSPCLPTTKGGVMELDLDQLEQELNEQLDALFRSVIDFNNHLVLYRLEKFNGLERHN